MESLMGPRGMGLHFTSSTETTVGKGRTEETEEQSDNGAAEVSAKSQLQNTEDGQRWHRIQLMDTS